MNVNGILYRRDGRDIANGAGYQEVTVLRNPLGVGAVLLGVQHIEKTGVQHFCKLLASLQFSETLTSYKIKVHIGTGLLFELAEEIIAIASPLNGPALTISDLKRGFSLAGVPFVPDPQLGTNFEVRICGGPRASE